MRQVGSTALQDHYVSPLGQAAVPSAGPLLDHANATHQGSAGPADGARSVAGGEGADTAARKEAAGADHDHGMSEETQRVQQVLTMTPGLVAWLRLSGAEAAMDGPKQHLHTCRRNAGIVRCPWYNQTTFKTSVDC